MVKIKLKIVGFPQRSDVIKEDMINVKNLGEIIQRVEATYPQDYYAFDIFLNGITVADEDTNLRDGDEVVIVPIMSGG